MQNELDTLDPPVAIALVGVNQIGSESGNASMTAGRFLPWLQDTSAEQAQAAWSAEHNDVVILDGQNQRYAIYNLGSYDLALTANYQTLRELLLAAAAAEGQ